MRESMEIREAKQLTEVGPEVRLAWLRNHGTKLPQSCASSTGVTFAPKATEGL